MDIKTSRTTTSATHAIAAYKILDGITKNGDSGDEEGEGTREVVDIESSRAVVIVETAEDCMKPVALGRCVHPTPTEIGSQQF